MPEGDTIHRAARTLRAALLDQKVVAVHSTVDAVTRGQLDGRTVERIEARGKNLLMHFDDGRVLYTHMKMTGSWHVYRDRDKWRKPPRQAKVVLHTEKRMAVCFNAPVVELLSALAVKRHRFLSTLGPDMLDETFDWPEIARRLRGHGHAP
ncbi:MAG: DNA-formamidopyrimidine glycosylase family protein, partial [Myxococcota bacterium]